MFRTTATILTVSALALAACEERPATRTNSNNNTTTTRPVTPPRTATPSTTPANDTDTRLASDIRQAIADDTAMPAGSRNITVTVVNGAVTLRGTVETQADKDAIEAKVKSIPGAGSVDNQIEVKTP